MPSSVQPRSSISGHAASSSPRPVSSQVAVDAVERGIVARAGRPGEVVEAQPQRERPPDPLAAAQPPGDPVDQTGEQGVEVRAALAVPGPADRGLRPDRAAPPADLDRARVAQVGQRPQVPAGGLADRGGQLDLLAAGELADGADARRRAAWPR